MAWGAAYPEGKAVLQSVASGRETPAPTAYHGPVNVWSDRIRPVGLAVALACAVLAASAAGVARASSTPVPSSTPPPTAPTPPPPAGTPWPPPTGLTLRIESVLLDANNLPLPPEKQAHTAVLTWALMPGYTGSYEVERATAAIGSSAPRTWTLAGTVPASSATAAALRWTGPIESLFLSNCFRVRTVIASAPGPETGPYSEAVCVQPPSSTAPPPSPPPVGNSAAVAGNRGEALPMGPVAAAAAFAVAPALAAWWAIERGLAARKR